MECRQGSYSLGDKNKFLNKITFIPLRNENFEFRSGINAKLYRFLKNPYILNTPNCCGGKGWFKEAAMPKARILRVSMGSMMPSSQRRAVL